MACITSLESALYLSTAVSDLQAALINLIQLAQMAAMEAVMAAASSAAGPAEREHFNASDARRRVGAVHGPRQAPRLALVIREREREDYIR